MGRLKHLELVAADRQQRAANLGDMLRRGLDIFCWCNRCGHNRTVASCDLIDRLGAGIPVPEIGARLRCAVCGSKDIATRPNWRGVGTMARSMTLTPQAPEKDSIAHETVTRQASSKLTSGNITQGLHILSRDTSRKNH